MSSSVSHISSIFGGGRKGKAAQSKNKVQYPSEREGLALAAATGLQLCKLRSMSHPDFFLAVGNEVRHLSITEHEWSEESVRQPALAPHPRCAALRCAALLCAALLCAALLCSAMLA